MFRKTLFWIHLVAGLISGVSIAIMCFTGTVLAFEKEIVAWSERDARRVEPPATTARLPLEQLQARLREAQPDARPMSIVVHNNPKAAVAFSAGRTGGYYVNPYTGEVRQPQSSAMSAFMRTMVEWHRYLGFTGETSRPQGKLINGICNLAFFALAVTGLYLWMPRSWSWRSLRPVVWFTQNSGGKARDFNWHNTIGFWSAPVLIVLTLTAVPISFRWGGTLIFALTGTPAPNGAPQGGPPGGGASVEITPPADGARTLGYDALLALVQKDMPRWEQITLRLGGGEGAARGGRGGGEGARGGRGGGARGGNSEARPAENRSVGAAEARPAPRAQAVSFTVREAGSWPRTATTTVSINPYTGEIVRRSGYADMNAAQQMRSWTRFLHTGEALGGIGQFVAGLACLGGVVLVYTGVGLSCRRFFGRTTKPVTAMPVAEQTADPAAAPRS